MKERFIKYFTKAGCTTAVATDLYDHINGNPQEFLALVKQMSAERGWGTESTTHTSGAGTG